MDSQVLLADGQVVLGQQVRQIEQGLLGGTVRWG